MTVLVGAASSMDFTARLIGDQLREKFNRPVVVSSKLGAGGRLALGELKRAAPDGMVLLSWAYKKKLKKILQKQEKILLIF
jgi:tripartite-type tricarboxylate transporter receptor subunit TctC